ncbi:Fic family protein [Desulfovibrio sp. JC022]|nr:Fic family protein [Desulfovibrio sp. JC022]
MSVKISVVEHMTFKTGKFKFSCEFDSAEILPLMVEARSLSNLLQSLPVLPGFLAKMETELIRRSIFGTAAIEGNPLSEDAVGELLKMADSLSDGKEISANQAEREIRNLKRLYKTLEDREVVTADLTENFIKSVHETVTAGIDYYHNSPGKYRNEVVKVGNAEHGGIYTPPKTLSDIRALMEIFISWINAPEMKVADLLLRAAAAHYHLAMIHPFQDGNGRTARFIEAVLLSSGEGGLLPLMMSNFYYRNIDRYFIAFSDSRKSGDMTPFLKFYFEGVIESLSEVQQKVLSDLNAVLIREYLSVLLREKKIVSRQHDLMLQLIETGKDVSLRALYGDPVFKPLYISVAESTARRDLKKLIELELIKPVAGKNYAVNWDRFKRL